MLRKLATLSLALISFKAIAQKKNLQKQSHLPALTSNIDYKAIGAPMPDIRAITAAGKEITQKNLDTLGNVFLVLFNPTCDHCQEVTRMLEKNINRFRDGQILLLAASGMLPYFNFFETTTQVSQYPRIRLAVDSAATIEKIYTYKSLPQINVYSRERKLLKTFTGAVPVDSLQPLIR